MNGLDIFSREIIDNIISSHLKLIRGAPLKRVCSITQKCFFKRQLHICGAVVNRETFEVAAQLCDCGLTTQISFLESF